MRDGREGVGEVVMKRVAAAAPAGALGGRGITDGGEEVPGGHHVVRGGGILRKLRRVPDRKRGRMARRRGFELSKRGRSPVRSLHRRGDAVDARPRLDGAPLLHINLLRRFRGSPAGARSPNAAVFRRCLLRGAGVHRGRLRGSVFVRVLLLVRGASPSLRRAVDVIHRGVDRAEFIVAELPGARDGMRRRGLRCSSLLGRVVRRRFLVQHRPELALGARSDARALAHLRDVRLVQHRETRVRESSEAEDARRRRPTVRTALCARRRSSTPRNVIVTGALQRNSNFRVRSCGKSGFSVGK